MQIDEFLRVVLRRVHDRPARPVRTGNRISRLDSFGRQQQAAALVEEGIAHVAMVHQHQRFFTERLVADLVRHPDLRAAVNRGDGPVQQKVLPEQLRFADIAAHGNDILLPFPARIDGDMLGGAGAHSPVHGIFPAVLRPIGRADVFVPAGEEKAAHNAALRLRSVGVKRIASVQSGLGQEGHSLALPAQLGDIHAFVQQDNKMHRPVGDLDRVESPRTALVIADASGIGNLLHASDVPQ